MILSGGYAVQLTTARNYLLLTERIGKKPMLRTRFTNQAYFVLASILDLIDQQVLAIQDDQLIIKDRDKFGRLPNYLSGFKARIMAEITKGNKLTDTLDLITSWDIANELYDGVGVELLRDQLVRKTSVKTNLDTHVIYLPTDAARMQVTDDLKTQMTAADISQATISLVTIYEQLDALKWLISDKNELAGLTQAFHRKIDDDPFYQTKRALVKTAQDVITKKKFWYDSWLS